MRAIKIFSQTENKNYRTVGTKNYVNGLTALITKTHHGIFLIGGGDANLVFFIAILNDHKGGIRWDTPKVFGHHYQYMFGIGVI